jgi:hypothetical protein
MLLAKVIASVYLLISLIGLVTASVPRVYTNAFWQPGKPWVGLLRWIHAYVAFLCIGICGASVWLFPRYSQALAFLALGVLVAGKVIRIFSGAPIRCPHCFALGLVAACLSTWAIVAGTS